MQQPEFFLVVGIIVLMVIMIYYYAKCKRRFTKLLFGAISGAGLLFPACWILNAMGYVFSVNVFTVSVSVVLGMPGVILLSAASLMK